MAGLLEVAAKIAADKDRTLELAARLAEAKDQAEGTAGELAKVGTERSAAHMQRAATAIEEALSLRAALDGGLQKAHWQVMSAVHGRMGPGAKGSGAIVPLGKAEDADGAPRGGLDAIPPHLRHGSNPSGEELLQPVDRRKAKNLFTESVSKGDQIDDASKFIEKNFESAWQAIHSEPSPGKAQENAVAMTHTSTGPVVTDVPAPQVTSAVCSWAPSLAASSPRRRRSSRPSKPCDNLNDSTTGRGGPKTVAKRNADDVALLTAMITKGSESPAAIAGRIGAARAYALASSALSVAATRRFPDGSTYADIRRYSKGIADRFPGGAELLAPDVVEAMIRTGRGEEGLLGSIDASVVQQLLLMLPYALMTEPELAAAEKESFIDEVLELADSE